MSDYHSTNNNAKGDYKMSRRIIILLMLMMTVKILKRTVTMSTITLRMTRTIIMSILTLSMTIKYQRELS